MPEWKLEAIIASLQFTDRHYPLYKDKFHEMRQMIDAWNDNMADIFTPGWASCLDESMSI